MSGAARGGNVVEERTTVHDGCKWMHFGEVCICMSSINTLNKMMASSALSRNGRLDGAGVARGWASEVCGNQDGRSRRVERVEGGRAHTGTRDGMSSLSITILTISSVFWIRFGMTRVSCERNLKYA